MPQTQPWEDSVSASPRPKRTSIPGFPGGMVSSFLTFVVLALMSRVPRSSPTIAPSMEMTFPFSHIPPLASIGADLGFIFLPVKYLVLRLKRRRTHSEILSKVSSDVFGLTCFLECLLRQLLDLDGCQLFLIPVNRQLSWCCDIELDEICWLSSECEFQWCYTPVGDSLIPDSCSCLRQLFVCHFLQCCRCCACLDGT